MIGGGEKTAEHKGGILAKWTFYCFWASVGSCRMKYSCSRGCKLMLTCPNSAPDCSGLLHNPSIFLCLLGFFFTSEMEITALPCALHFLQELVE